VEVEQSIAGLMIVDMLYNKLHSTLISLQVELEKEILSIPIEIPKSSSISQV
jgi:hypothetical protein